MIAVPIDLSWDTDCKPTYKPEEYIVKNLILRKPPHNLSKSAKKKFRLEERLRFQKIASEENKRTSGK